MTAVARWTLRVAAFAGSTLAVTGAGLIGATVIGFLVYSDRPGPGYYGPWLDLLHEIRFLLSFMVFLVVPLLLVGAIVLLIETVYERLRLPGPSMRIAGALAAGVMTGFVTAGVGWYISLSGLGSTLDLGAGAVVAFVLFPHRISRPTRPRSSAALARSAIATLAGIPLAVAPLALITAWLLNIRGPVVYEIPDRYHGAVVVAYGRQACPRPHLRGVDLIVSIDERGCGCTSEGSPWPGTWRWDPRFVYVSAGSSTRELAAASFSTDGGKVRNGSGEVWGITLGLGGSPPGVLSDHFYVGGGDEYRRWYREIGRKKC